jgi:hypothetical protein
MSKGHLIADVVTIGRVLTIDPSSIKKSNASEQYSLNSFQTKKLLMFIAMTGFLVYTFFLISNETSFIQKIDTTPFTKYLKLLNKHY